MSDYSSDKKPVPRLKRKLEDAALAVVTSRTVREAATQCGISEQTLYRWLKDEAFNAMISAKRRQVMQATVNRLVATSLDAVEVLHSIAKSPMAEDGNKVSASRSLLQYAVQAGVVADIEDRLNKMEAGSSNDTPESDPTL